MVTQNCPTCDRSNCPRWVWALSYSETDPAFFARENGHGRMADRDNCDRNRMDWRAEAIALRETVKRMHAAVNTPQISDFTTAVTLEAAHQRERWGIAHDAGKRPEDWFTLVAYLQGKAVKAHFTGDRDKLLHHIISTAAALANQHAAMTGGDNHMRPGVGPEVAP